MLQLDGLLENPLVAVIVVGEFFVWGGEGKGCFGD